MIFLITGTLLLLVTFVHCNEHTREKEIKIEPRLPESQTKAMKHESLTANNNLLLTV